jgi:hypothetical protein
MSRGGKKPAPAPAPVAQVRPAPVTTPKPAANNAYKQAAAALTDASRGARSVMNYQPERVSTTFGYTPQDVAAQSAVGGIDQYMNPYTQNVIDLSMQDMERQRMMQQQQIGAQAASAGAFGGSRQGLVEAETNRGFAQQGGMLASQLRNQGFQTALGASQQDVTRQLQAALANQAANARAAEFGQATGLQAQGMNQQAGLQGAQVRLGGAGTLGNLGSTQFNMANTLQQQQAAQGLLQQQMRQQQLNDAQQQFYGYANSPLNYVNMMNQSLAGSPLSGASTSQYRPGALDYLSLGTGLMAL